ncbi:hypothetical protein [Streptosporangium longisporum]|uniref:DUF1349 domain-containing protein n=1 Tax=Streptosporangium longisporum TaxID=46187 RepID=A0ABP6KSI2_9ACTN
MPRSSEDTAEPSLTVRVRREWGKFRTRGRTAAMTSAILVTVLLGVLSAIATSLGTSCTAGTVEVPCPADPAGPHGRAVSDTSYLVHRPLGRNGEITVRLTSMTGIITYPPPGHDEIVPGLVPWAKAGVIIKDGTARGSSYAALMLTGAHGVRMQHDYVHDTAGRPGGVSPRAPRWLRLTRSGDTVTGHESADGTRWAKVGTARLPALPETVRVGLFVASPGDLTLTRVGLGASLPESRFTQATAVFDHVSVRGGTSTGGWSHGSVGEMGHTDWERHHRPPGLVESDGTFTVTGTGDIGPVGTGVGHAVEGSLAGLVVGLVIVMVVAVRFMTTEYRPGPAGGAPGDVTGGAADGMTGGMTGGATGDVTGGMTGGATGDVTGGTAGDVRGGASGGAAPAFRTAVAKAVVTAAVTFAAGLVAAAVVVAAGPRILRAGGAGVLPVPLLTELRVVAGAAALLAVAAVLALALGALLRRTWAAILVAISAVVLPYLLAVLPILPDDVARWLLRLTPAAGFAVYRTAREYPQVVAHYAPSAGYPPLPWWAGFGVLCGYAVAVLALVRLRSHRRDGERSPR